PYLDRSNVTLQRYFPVPAGAPAEALAPFAPRYPVFELIPVATGGAPRPLPTMDSPFTLFLRLTCGAQLPSNSAPFCHGGARMLPSNRRVLLILALRVL